MSATKDYRVVCEWKTLTTEMIQGVSPVDAFQEMRTLLDPPHAGAILESVKIFDRDGEDLLMTVNMAT